MSAPSNSRSAASGRARQSRAFAARLPPGLARRLALHLAEPVVLASVRWMSVLLLVLPFLVWMTVDSPQAWICTRNPCRWAVANRPSRARFWQAVEAEDPSSTDGPTS